MGIGSLGAKAWSKAGGRRATTKGGTLWGKIGRNCKELRGDREILLEMEEKVKKHFNTVVRFYMKKISLAEGASATLPIRIKRMRTVTDSEPVQPSQ